MNLYERITHGDRRTIVRKYKKGDEIKLEQSTVVIKADAAAKVTQQYSATLRTWQDVHVYLNDMVETSPPLSRPPSAPFRPERVNISPTTPPPGDWIINDIRIGNVSQISRWWHVRLWNRTIGRLWRRLTRRFRRPPITRLINGDKP